MKDTLVSLCSTMGFPGGSEVKASAWNAGDPGLIPGSGRSPEEGNGTPLQYSCLENPMEGGVWQATVHGVAKSRTRLSDFTSLTALDIKKVLILFYFKTFYNRVKCLIITVIYTNIIQANLTTFQVIFFKNVYSEANKMV